MLGHALPMRKRITTRRSRTCSAECCRLSSPYDYRSIARRTANVQLVEAGANLGRPCTDVEAQQERRVRRARRYDRSGAAAHQISEDWPLQALEGVVMVVCEVVSNARDFRYTGDGRAGFPAAVTASHRHCRCRPPSQHLWCFDGELVPRCSNTRPSSTER